MRMKKHVQKKNNFGSYWIFQQRSNLVYCAPSSNILHLRPQEFAPILRHAIVLESCFFFLNYVHLLALLPPPHPLKRAARSLALPPVGEWGEETDDILDYRHIWTMISYLPLVPVVLEGREGLGDPKNKNWQ